MDGKDGKEMKVIWSVIFYVGDGEEMRGFYGIGVDIIMKFGLRLVMIGL